MEKHYNSVYELKLKYIADIASFQGRPGNEANTMGKRELHAADVVAAAHKENFLATVMIMHWC